MASRLASLTPSKDNHARGSSSPSLSPATVSPSKQSETTHHRMLKLVVKEVQNTIKTWDELIILDGFKAAKGCVDESTEMDNILELEDRLEREEIGSHLAALYRHRAVLQATMRKLDANLDKLTQLADQAEKILFGAYQRESDEFVFDEPLWTTWTLEHFINSIASLISSHTQHLSQLSILASRILDPETTFKDAKVTLESWRDLSSGGDRWESVREWEELMEIEMFGELDEEDEEVSKRKKKRR
ncbi:uncharacterized protein L203_100781 [Cryptococcus depauperatus CBS 7841]|uniref:Uncharacterized protein n=1 Tax=Cryptococcus depauperatus CBS 7841 TaxID=1295531 RepID=A0A1E3IXM8_9TREE|nr:hypothetical protein L203_00569 [Cryptococcus depauperatus CBS 7841]